MISKLGTVLSYAIIVSIVAVTLFIYYGQIITGEVEYVRSDVDGQEYLVRNLKDKKQAANMLSDVKNNMKKMVDHIQEHFPDDDLTARLKENFRCDGNITEATDTTKYTSYSINKGEKFVFCIRQRDAENNLVDINTMNFVALHELAHVCTKSIGHTEEFWDNFKFILEEAIKCGVWKYTPYHENPVPYCGIMVSDTPYKK